jgi:hypothetical protein
VGLSFTIFIKARLYLVFSEIKMTHYDLYFIEERDAENPGQRDPKSLAIEAQGVMRAGVHFISHQYRLIKHQMYRAMPYNEWHNSRDMIDKLVPSSKNPSAVFAEDVVIANANFSTEGRLSLSTTQLKTLDTLMEGIGMVPLREKVD